MRIGFDEHGYIFFFFQAEDGIRDLTVTGVQTCALPILRGFRARRLSLETKFNPQFGPKIRVRHSPHRSERENLQPPQHFRLRHGHWGPLVRQPGTEGLCAENWLGLGPVQEWKDFGAIWVWNLLRPASPKVLCIFGQPQSAIHDAHEPHKSPISERRARFQRERSSLRSSRRPNGRLSCRKSQGQSPDGELRPATLLYHAVQLKRAARSAW